MKTVKEIPGYWKHNLAPVECVYLVLALLFVSFSFFEIWWIRNTDKRESKSAEHHRRRCVPIYHMHMLLVLSDVSSFLVSVRVTWAKATITLLYPSLVFLPFKDMGSTVEIDIHLTVQL